LFLGWGAALATGAAIGLRQRFSVSAFWDDVRNLHATSFLYIGEMCRYLLAAPVRPDERDHSLRVAVGNGLRPDLWKEFQQRFGIPIVREFYGATEGNAPLLNMSGRPGMLGRRGRGQMVAQCDPTTGVPVRDTQGHCRPVAAGETGLLLGRISSVLDFDGYKDTAATNKKILRNVRRDGDRYFDTGDLVKLHTGDWLSFVDRVGDSYRWKGENVSAQEVADILASAPNVETVAVYGVPVPGCEGQAGMAAVRGSKDFALNAFEDFVMRALPGYQRPLFLRLLEEPIRTTSTFKPRTASYREEGYDPNVLSAPLFVSANGRYQTLSKAIHKALLQGEFTVS
jgi:acyl-CoA synthetase (AMP-forming)/AMP-acid ligase II